MCIYLAASLSFFMSEHAVAAMLPVDELFGVSETVVMAEDLAGATL